MPQLNKKHFVNRLPDKGKSKVDKRPYLELNPRAWIEIVVFLMSMAALGLEFYPAVLVVVMLMIKSFINNRHEFIVQLTLFTGAYGFYYCNPLIIRNDFLVFIIAIFLASIHRKPPIVKRTFLILGVFLLSIIILAGFSDVPMLAQISKMRHYLYFIYFYLPLIAFDGIEFNFNKFMTHVIGYTIVIGAFYIIDSCILCSHVMVPRVFDHNMTRSTWRNLHIHLLQHPFRRIYPPGMYLAALSIYGIVRIYRLRTWHWFLLLSGLGLTKTITFLTGLFITYCYVQGSIRLILKYAFSAIIAVALLYSVDVWIENNTAFNSHDTESPLRIRSTFTQIADAAAAKTEEDLATFGSGRMAQVIPKFELMYKYGKEWTGLGFLDRKTTTDTRFFIDNDFYENPDAQSEVATGVEIAYAQTILNIGYIGLIVQLLVYFALAMTIRKLRYFNFFISVLVVFLIFGINGICSINIIDGLLLLGLAYATVLLANRDVLPGFNTPWLSNTEKWRFQKSFNNAQKRHRGGVTN